MTNKRLLSLMTTRPTNVKWIVLQGSFVLTRNSVYRKLIIQYECAKANSPRLHTDWLLSVDFLRCGWVGLKKILALIGHLIPRGVTFAALIGWNIFSNRKALKVSRNNFPAEMEKPELLMISSSVSFYIFFDIMYTLKHQGYKSVGAYLATHVSYSQI